MRLRFHCLSRVDRLLALLLAAAPAHAVVIRDDVPDSKYLVSDNDFPALVDLPGEGHGVLITNRWVVTAAHAVRWGTPKQVTIKGKPRAVAALVIHPGFKMAPRDLMSGDAAALMAANAASDDIALIELAAPVTDLKPTALYRAADESGKLVKIYGKGATGNGRVGQYKDSPHRGKLRRAYNIIISAYGKWIAYRFDSGANALPLEGQLGDGDSGGPVLIQVGSEWKLAGLADWKYWKGDLSAFRAGIYGQVTYHVRISHYAAWIDQVISTRSSKARD